MKYCAFILLTLITHAHAMRQSSSTGVFAMDISDEENNDTYSAVLGSSLKLNVEPYASLMKASFKNDLDTVKHFLSEYEFEQGCVQTQWGTNPLNWAAFHGNVNMCEMLLNNGFGVTLERDGSSAIHMATFLNKVAVLKLLLVKPSSSVDARKPVETLVQEHFQKIIMVLRTPAITFGVRLTPFDFVPGPEQNSVCKDVLNPEGFRERLEPAITGHCNALITAALLKRN